MTAAVFSVYAQLSRVSDIDYLSTDESRWKFKLTKTFQDIVITPGNLKSD